MFTCSDVCTDTSDVLTHVVMYVLTRVVVYVLTHVRTSLRASSRSSSAMLTLSCSSTTALRKLLITSLDAFSARWRCCRRHRRLSLANFSSLISDASPVGLKGRNQMRRYTLTYDTCVYMCVYMCVCVYIYLCKCVYVCMCVYISV